MPATGVRKLKIAEVGRRGCKRCFDQLERWSPESLLHQCNPVLHQCNPVLHQCNPCLHQCNRLLVHMLQNTLHPLLPTLGTCELSDTCSRHSGSQCLSAFAATSVLLNRCKLCIDWRASVILVTLALSSLKQVTLHRTQRHRERSSTADMMFLDQVATSVCQLWIALQMGVVSQDPNLLGRHLCRTKLPRDVLNSKKRCEKCQEKRPC